MTSPASGDFACESPEDVPEFEISLNPEQLGDLARFVVTWSQVDFLVSNIVVLIARDKSGKPTVQVENTSLAARAGHLRGLASRMPSDQAKNDLVGICDILDELIPARDHVMHGLWGLFVDRKDMNARAACFYGPAKGAPIFAADLPDMAREAARVSRQLGSLLGLLEPMFKQGAPPRRFFFSDGPPPAPA